MSAYPLVKDFMTRDLITFRPDQDVYDAADTLLENSISGAPVVDKSGRLLGILSEKDCLKIMPKGSQSDSKKRKVADYMTKHPQTVTPETDINTVADIFLKHFYRRLPVVKNGFLVGQISRRDVLKWDKNVFHCHDLPTKPRPNIGKILVTGATGYIGGRLVTELLARGYRVKAMVRDINQDFSERWPNAEVAVADAHDLKQLQKALKGIHTAYYLIHSLLLGPKKFETADIVAAVNFRKACESQKVKRIIYLGALGDNDTELSPHLHSRIRVANELEKSTVPATILRAAIIIGSGSASYEIINNLVKNSPVFFNTYWVRTKCQPISIRDIIKYLVGVLEIPATKGKSFDIGCDDILSYREMLTIQAKLLGKKRIFLPTLFSSIKFFSYIASFLTPVPAPIIYSLMQSLKNNVVCRDNEIKKYLPFKPISYREALVRAMTREEQDKVRTRWSDSYPPAYELAIKLNERIAYIRFKYKASIYTTKSRTAIFRSLSKIGGKTGWLYSNWLWKLRGLIDRLFFGVGISRGRRSSSSLRINDVIDFWRVENLRVNEQLLLRAEMKLPGRAWLEFRIENFGNRNRLTVRAYFHTKSLFGKLYWNMTMPLHNLIFKSMLKEIIRKS